MIFLFQSGAPSQMDLFDYKPALKEKRGIELPTSIRMGQRITTMTSGQKSLPVAPTIFKFAQHGHSGTWLSELLPHTASIADELCVLRTMKTEAINHDPAVTFCQTGSQLAGRPSMGAGSLMGSGARIEICPHSSFWSHAAAAIRTTSRSTIAFGGAAFCRPGIKE